MVECRICNQEVAGLNLGWGLLHIKVYSAFHPSEVGKWEDKGKKAVWLIPIADERVGVQVKLVKSLESTCHT